MMSYVNTCDFLQLMGLVPKVFYHCEHDIMTNTIGA